MADRVSIAIRQQQAFARITAAAGRLSTSFGVDAPLIPTQGRDVELLRAQQFEGVAEWAEALADALDATPVAGEQSATPSEAETETTATVPNYKRMKKPQLVALAVERGMAVEDAEDETIAELVDYLEAAAGITENQQAAADAEADTGESE